MKSVGSKPCTWHAIVVALSEVSNVEIWAAPLRPAIALAQFSARPMPSEVTRPRPVTTTRLRALMTSPARRPPTAWRR